MNECMLRQAGLKHRSEKTRCGICYLPDKCYRCEMQQEFGRRKHQKPHEKLLGRVMIKCQMEQIIDKAASKPSTG